MAPTSQQPGKEPASDSPTMGSSRGAAASAAPTTEGQGTNAAENIAQAYRDLARGEQTASALEANLSKLESRLDELLAGFEDIGGDGSLRDGEVAAPDARASQQQSTTSETAQNPTGQDGDAVGAHPGFGQHAS